MLFSKYLGFRIKPLIVIILILLLDNYSQFNQMCILYHFKYLHAIYSYFGHNIVIHNCRLLYMQYNCKRKHSSLVSNSFIPKMVSVFQVCHLNAIPFIKRSNKLNCSIAFVRNYDHHNQTKYPTTNSILLRNLRSILLNNS